MVVIKKNGLRRKIKLHFVGISQAYHVGLEKAPRWAKMLSKTFPIQEMLFVIVSLSLYIYVCVC